MRSIEAGEIHQRAEKNLRGYGIGRNRLLAISLSSLLLASCDVGSFLFGPTIPTPTPVPTLTPDKVALLCSQPLGGIVNPSISSKEEYKLINLTFKLTGSTEDPVLSPDNSKIVFSAQQNSIDVANVDGSGLNVLSVVAPGLKNSFQDGLRMENQ